MILEDEVVGVLQLWRTDVAPFDERELELLDEFAVQGAIALRQVELVQALEARGAELASKVAQLEALREVGEAVSSSLDLDEVLEQIVTNAVRLTGTDGGSIMEYDEEDEAFSVRTAYGSSRELLEQLRAVTIRRESTLVGRAALDRRPLEVPDLAESELDPHLEILFRDGWRSVLAVPHAARRPDGRRRWSSGAAPPAPSPRTCPSCCETFASQSALAILNARLFRELETKRRELEVVSRHKSEFLASMSHELRTPAERGDRLLRGAARPDVRRAQRAAGRVPPRHLELRPAPARAAQRDPRPVQGRGRADGARATTVQRCRGARVRAVPGPRAGAAHAITLDARGRRRRGTDRGRRAALQAGGAQPADQRGEVHAGRGQGPR